MPTTYMNLVLPEPSVTIGPDWAVSLNTALTIVDTHDHSSGKGQKITTAGLNIAADLTLNNNDLTDVSGVVFQDLSSDPSSTVTAYTKNGDLYYKDSAGNAVRITASGALDLSGTGGITGDYTTTSAVAFYTDSSLTFFFQDSNTDPSILSYGTAEVGDGTVSLPSFTFTSDKNTGIYSGGADTLNFATAGTQAVSINSSQETTFAAQLYLPNNVALNWRNNANSAYIPLTVNTSDDLLYNSNPVVTLANGTAHYLLKMNAGGTDFEYGQLVNASIDASAAIDATKIHDGCVSNIEFGYLDGLSGSIQSQLDGKVGIGGNESIGGDKTFTDNVDLDNPLIMAHSATPSNPASSHNKLYFKSDNKLYSLDSGGTETDISVGAGTASATAQGLVTSYTPTIQSSVHTVTNDNYTILDNDGYDTILVSGGSSDRTITLPTLADNVGRKITIMRIDAPSSGTPGIVIDGEGAETIDGAATTTIGQRYDNTYTGQWASITLLGGVTQWHVIGTTNDVIYAESTASWATSVQNANTITIPAGRWRVTVFSYRSSGTADANISVSLSTTSATHNSALGKRTYTHFQGVTTVGTTQLTTTEVVTSDTTYYHCFNTANITGGSTGSHFILAERVG